MRMTTPPSLIFLLLLCASTRFATSSTGFRVQLTHVDAKANLTMAERLRRAGTRLHRRFELVSGGVTAPVVSQDSGFYIAEFGIGNPPQVVQAIVTTTIDLVSTQCSTCRPKCFNQNLDYYDYHKSTTGQPVPCDDTMCVAADGIHGTKPCTDDDDGTCRIPGNDNDLPGVLRTDEFTFGPAKVNITFSCTGQLTDAVGDDFFGASGFIGLGRSAMSLVSQVGSRRFSYCLTRPSDLLHSSPLFIGSSAGLSGDAPVTSTPFAVNPYPHEAVLSSFYYLSMSGMSVGEASLDIPGEAFRSGVVIDNTMPFTYLADSAYMALKKEMSRQLGSSLVPSPVESLELCVARGDVGRMIPPLVLHLDGGDLALPADNYWAPIDLETSCMMVVRWGPGPSPYRGISVIGSYMQQDIHILYDLDGESISFQPADCTSI